MGQALVTGVLFGLLGLVVTSVLGLTAADNATISRHVTFGIFSTMLLLLAHSMMMFYLIGKGKAVKDAMTEGGLSGPDNPHFRLYVSRIAQARRPVFSVGTLAMAMTMVAAILGASVDTGVLPPAVHAMLAYGAIIANIAALKVEIHALMQSSRVVDEVNQLLASSG
jgi:hypothetical protein